ncbi:MAG: FAD-dependent oxidoreductase [Planctomycetia bacterium]|nr:FAD-dependent oxidoreductase [Planctomycetia bacterium]
MKKKFGWFLCALLMISAGICSADPQKNYDVVIYGGTCASITAAVQVKKMGKTVAVVSPDTHLGGLSSSGLGATDSGNRSVIGGLSREFYHRIWQYYQKKESWIQQEMPVKNGIPGQCGRGIDNETQTMWVFEPHAAEMVFEDFIKEYNIPVFRNEWLDREKGVVKKGTKILSIKTLSGKVFSGSMFLDTTYEGDLMAAAGVQYTVGRESNAMYNETLNGIQTKRAVSHQFLGFVDPYIVPGKPESGLLPYVFKNSGGQDGEADSKIQAYNLRLCITQIPENRVPITKPDHYDPLQYELFLRSIEAGQKHFFIHSRMPNHKTDSNNNNAFSSDLIGGNYEYPEASYEVRRAIYENHRQWCAGILWTLANNPRVPEKVRKEYQNWGLAKDEFTDNGNWPWQMYVREARRMISDFVVSERHLRLLDPTDRPIGLGSYNMDSHNAQRYVDYEMFGKPSVRNEGDIQINPGGPYPIDYGAILPKKDQAVNLLVPVCVSCSHIAFGSIRMEPVFMILGQSAAAAAVLSLEKGVVPQDLNYQDLQKRLLEDQQILSYTRKPKGIPAKSLPGIVIDSADAKITGEWKNGTTVDSYINEGYLHDCDQEKGKKSIEFSVKVPKPGKYECRLAYTPHSNRATNVPVEIRSGSKSRNVEVNQKKQPPIDNLWISLGSIEADDEIRIMIRNDQTKGHVIVDAVQIL